MLINSLSSLELPTSDHFSKLFFCFAKKYPGGKIIVVIVQIMNYIVVDIGSDIVHI